MKETTLIKIPILDTIFKGLEEAFIGEESNYHDFVWKQISTVLRDARAGELTKSCSVSVIKNGKQESETVRLKEVKLENIPSNPKWIPENMDASEVKYLEHKFTETEMKFLKLGASFSILRHSKFSESLRNENQIGINKMISNNAQPQQIEDAKAESKTTMELFEKGKPKCLEQVLYNAIYPPIYKKVMEDLDDIINKEHEQTYPKEKKTSS